MAGFDDLQQFLALVRAQDNLVLLGHRPKFTTQNLLVKPLVSADSASNRYGEFKTGQPFRVGLLFFRESERNNHPKRLRPRRTISRRLAVSTAD
jgi:hypothetical protein